MGLLSLEAGGESGSDDAEPPVPLSGSVPSGIRIGGNSAEASRSVPEGADLTKLSHQTGPEAHAKTTRDPLLGALSAAMVAASAEGRVDVVGELAAIVSRLAAEERAKALEVAGVPMVSAKRGKQG